MTAKTGSNIIINKPPVLRVNQRAAERTRRTNRITVRVVKIEGETVLESRLVDVSQGGFAFEATVALEPGERLRARIEMESSQIVSQFALFVQGEAIARRCRSLVEGEQWLIGAAWDRLEKAEKEKWATFLGKARSLLF